MKLPGRRTSAYITGFVIFILAFAYLELAYARRVDSTSMLPTLEPGDLVVVQHVSISDVRVGDIIIYDPPCSATGYTVIHRVVQIQNTGLITKGDNNPGTDQFLGIATSPITQDCLSGKVVFVVPYIERLATLPFGTNYILAILIIFAVLYSELSSRGRDKSEEDNEKGASVVPKVSPDG
ncbi:MAG: signal peptidase I [Thaumarchaeota archaeon]|nr:signal peptidase I [Nitrososphaerota archaeon]